MDEQRPTVIFLMGPTSAGKTGIAVDLVKYMPCDIISVDSAMIYKGMDIGTAKPDPDTLSAAPHRLIDICDPSESYSAAKFRLDALVEIEKIIKAGRIPLLVGGTMLYFRALEKGLSVLPSADQQVRERLDLEAKEKGWRAMHERLTQIDPKTAQRIHPNDPQRIQRALEVYEIEGKTLTELFDNNEFTPLPYHTVKLALAPGARSELHRRIDQRFQEMLESGFVEEVAGLFERGDLHLDLPSMRAVGYRQIWEYLSGSVTHQEAVERAVIATRQLAKRQLTWLRADKENQWFDPDEKNLLGKILKYTGNDTIYK